MTPPSFSDDTAIVDTGQGLLDLDGDGFGTAEGDCDDADETAYPGNEEICDGVDNDCNKLVDDDATDATTWYADKDEDTYGQSGEETEACEAPVDSTDRAGDCDDTDASVNPGESETWYDGTDQDCDGNDSDQDEDGFDAIEADGEDCDDTDDTVYPNAEDGAGEEALGDTTRSAAGSPLVDDDCDGYVDEEAIAKGDLIITEINNYSSAGGSSADSRNRSANWFEVYNDSPLTLDLSNWTFAVCDYAASGGVGFDEGEPAWSYCDEIQWFSISPEAELVLAPEGYAVLCRDDSVFDNADDCDYSYGGSTAIIQRRRRIPSSQRAHRYRALGVLAQRRHPAGRRRLVLPLLRRALALRVEHVDVLGHRRALGDRQQRAGQLGQRERQRCLGVRPYGKHGNAWKRQSTLRVIWTRLARATRALARTLSRVYTPRTSALRSGHAFSGLFGSFPCFGWL